MNQLTTITEERTVKNKRGDSRVLPRESRSLFMRILVTFFFLSSFPVVLYGIFGATVYVGSIKKHLPIAEAITIEQVLFTQMILTLLLVILAVIFAASLISSSLIRPLRRLLELTRLVGSGKLQYMLKVSSRDEIGELTEALNVMVARLRNQQAREQLVGKLKSEFISIAAHQLRTPLSAIKWTFRMLIDKDLGELTKEQQEFLGRAYNTNEHMILLVNDLLDAARIEEGKFGYEFKPADLTPFIRESATRLASQAASRGIVISFEESKMSIPQLNLDINKLNLVFQNVLDNAIKYSKPQSTVTISVREVPHFVEVTIADQGVGIPKNQMNRLFTKFFRADNVMRMETEGSGLGLFIARNIMINHGGDITIQSEENKGTRVILTFPLSQEAIPKEEITFEEFIISL